MWGENDAPSAVPTRLGRVSQTHTALQVLWQRICVRHNPGQFHAWFTTCTSRPGFCVMTSYFGMTKSVSQVLNGTHVLIVALVIHGIHDKTRHTLYSLNKYSINQKKIEKC